MLKTLLVFISLIVFVVVASVWTGLAQDRVANGDRFEVSSIKAVRPTLVSTLSALQKQDVPAAKAAFDAYDRAWNGIEVYINFRYLDMYNLIEHTYQDRITKGLNEPSRTSRPSLPMPRPCFQSLMKPSA